MDWLDTRASLRALKPSSPMPLFCAEYCHRVDQRESWMSDVRHDSRSGEQTHREIQLCESEVGSNGIGQTSSAIISNVVVLRPNQATDSCWCQYRGSWRIGARLIRTWRLSFVIVVLLARASLRRCAPSEPIISFWFIQSQWLVTWLGANESHTSDHTNTHREIQRGTRERAIPYLLEPFLERLAVAHRAGRWRTERLV